MSIPATSPDSANACSISRDLPAGRVTRSEEISSHPFFGTAGITIAAGQLGMTGFDAETPIVGVFYIGVGDRFDDDRRRVRRDGDAHVGKR
jgi:hypothetical protein